MAWWIVNSDRSGYSKLRFRVLELPWSNGLIMQVLSAMQLQKNHQIWREKWKKIFAHFDQPISRVDSGYPEPSLIMMMPSRQIVNYILILILFVVGIQLRVNQIKCYPLTQRVRRGPLPLPQGIRICIVQL